MRHYFGFLLLFLAIAAALRVDFFFSIVYLFFAVYALSRLWARQGLEGLRAERRLAERAFLGDEVAVELTVENRRWLPVPWVEVSDALPVQLITPPFFRQVASLNGRERRTFRYTLHCRQRGYHPIGPLQLRSGDLLGIERQRAREVAPDFLIVYPRVVALEQLGLPTRSPLVALPARAPLFEDPARIMGVRPYQRGDSPRRIHWTATASAGQMLVKQYQPAIAREAMICLELNEESYERGQRFTATELAIVVAASLANHIVMREGLPVGLATEAHDPLPGATTRIFLPPRRERAHLMALLERLARVQPTTGVPLEARLRHECASLPWGTTVAVVTGHAPPTLLDTLAALRRAGLAVALILVQPYPPPAEVQRRAALLGLALHRVWSEWDLETWR